MTRSVGVKAVFDVTDFEKGLNAYIDGLNRALSATDNFADKINAAMNQAASGVKSTLDGVAKDLNNFTASAEAAAKKVSKVRSTRQSPSTQEGQTTALAVRPPIILPQRSTAVQRYEPPAIKIPEFRPERLLVDSKVIDAQFKVVEQKLLTYNQSFSDIIKNMISNLSQSTSGLGNAFGNIGSRITGGFSSAVNAVRGAFSSLTNAAQQGSTQTTNQVRSIGPALGSAFSGIGSAISSSVSGTVGAIQKGLSGITTAFGSFRQAILSAAGTTDSQLSTFATGFVQGVGQEAVRFLQSLGNEIRNLTQEGIQLATFFERLGLSVRYAVAQELRQASGYVLEMDSALAQAGTQAEGFLLRLQSTAVNSIYTFQEVGAAASQAIIGGFDQGQTLRLVQALTDYGSAVGLTNEKINSAIYALAEISNNGKVYRSELRQLTSAQIDWRKALEEELGITDEIIREREEAKQPIAGAGEFLNALIGNLEKNAGGFGERAAKSLSGMVSTLSEIRQLALSNIFGGIFKGLSQDLSELLIFVKDPAFLPFFKALGETIGSVVATGVQALRNAIGGLVGAYQSLTPQQKELLFVFIGTGAAVTTVIAAISAFALAIMALANPVTVIATAVAGLFTIWFSNFAGIRDITLSVLDTIGGALQRLADEAVAWGSNIVTSLSDGIVGAVGAVFDALSVIGGAITGLLQPGSPPKLLPDLDKWGTEAAEVYLDGWTQADFGMLDKIAGYFNSFFNSLAGQGKVKQTDVPKLTIKVKEAVAQAIAEFKKFGAINEETLAKIAKLGGPIGGVLTTYVQKYVQLTNVTNQVAAAQEKLNGITQKYDRILRPLQQQLAKIQDIRQTQSEDKRIRELQNILNSKYASDIRKRDAQLELQEILLQQQIRKTTLNRDEETAGVQDQLTLAQQQQQALQGELGLFESKIGQQQEYNQLLAQSIKQLADGFAGVGKAIKEGLSELEKQLKAIQFQREALRDHVRAAELRYLIEQDSTTEAQKKAYQLELQELSLRRQQRIIEATKLGITLPDFSNIPVTMDDFSAKTKKADKEVGVLGGSLEGLKNLDLTKSVDDFNKSLDDARKKFEGLGTNIQATLQKVNDSLPKFLQFLGDDGKFSTTSEGIKNITAAFKGLAIGLSAFFATRTLANLAASLLGFRGTLSLVSTALGLFVTAWQGNWFNIQGVVQGAVDTIKSVLGGDFTSFAPLQWLMDLYDRLQKRVKEATNGVVSFGDALSIIAFTVWGKLRINLLAKYLPLLLSTRFGKIASLLVKNLFGLRLGFLGVGASTTVIIGVMKTLFGVFGGLIGRTTLILLAYNTITQAYISNWFGIRDKTIGAIQSILEWADKLFGTDGFTRFGDAVAEAFTIATESIGKLTSGEIGLGEFLAGLLVPFSFLKDTFDAIVNTVGGLIEKFFGFKLAAIGVSLGITGLNTLIGTIWGSLTSLLGVFTGGSGGGLLAVIAAFSTRILGLLTNSNVIILGLSLFYQAYQENWFGIRDITDNVIGTILKKLDEWTGTSAFSTMGERIREFFKDLIEIKDLAFASLFGGEVEAQFPSSFEDIMANNKKVGPEQSTPNKLTGKLNDLLGLDEFLRTIEQANRDTEAFFVGLDKHFGTDFGGHQDPEAGALANLLGFPQFLKAVADAHQKNLELFESISNWAKTAYDYLVKVQEIMEKIGNFLGLPDLGATGEQAGKEFGGGFQNGFLSAGSIGSDIADKLRKDLEQKLTTSPTTIPGGFLLPGIAGTKAGEELKAQVDASLAESTEPSGVIKFGLLVSAGLIRGIATGLGIQNIFDLTASLIEFKKYWGIQSPSKKAHDEMGLPIGQGITGGIAAGITATVQAVIDTVVGLKDLLFSSENIAAFGTAALDLGKSIIQGIMDGINSLYEGAKTLFDNTIGNLIGGAKELLGLGGQEAASGVTEGLSQGLAALDRDELVGVFAEAIIAAFEQMKGNVVGTFTTMSTDVQTALTALQTSATAIVTQFTLDTSLAFLTMGLEIVADTDLLTATLLERYGAFKESLVGDEGIVNQITATTVQFFSDMASTVVAAVDSMVANILEAFVGDEGLLAQLRTNFVDAGESLGRDFIAGIERGIQDNIDSIKEAAKKVADDAVDAAREGLEAESPSKRAAREIGEPFAEGISKGILSGLGLLTQNTGSVIESLFGITSAIESRLGASPSGAVVNNSSNRTNNFNLSVNSNVPSAGVVRDFGIMQTLAGAA